MHLLHERLGLVRGDALLLFLVDRLLLPLLLLRVELPEVLDLCGAELASDRNFGRPKTATMRFELFNPDTLRSMLGT